MIARFKSVDDIREAEARLAESDSKMAELIEKFGPCDITPWQRDLYTSLSSSIVSQQLSVKAASTIFGRLMAQASDGVTLNHERVLALSHDELRACGLSNAKAKYCVSLATAVKNNDIHFEELQNLPDESVIEILIQLPGIGRWTAEMFLIFALGSTDVLATDDLGLKRGMQRYLSLEDYPEKSLFIEKSAPWKPYRSVASWYLWRLAD